MRASIVTIALILFHLTSFCQWEQRANTPFLKDHGIGFSLGGYGYVLTGGEDGQVFSSSKDFFRYDPSTDSWLQLPDYPGPARGYGIGDVWNGKMYFGFGSSGFINLNDLWSWDPNTDTFEQLPSCPCAGRVHPAFVIADGKIYVGAGGGLSGNLNDFWEFDIATEMWNPMPDIPGPRHHPYQFELNGDIYVGNGHLSSWYRYTPGSNNWVQVASLPTRVAGAQFSYNGKGYALSGTDTNHNRFATGEFWEYDPIADTWTALPPHPGTSRFAPSQFVIGTYIYILGGYDRFDPTGTLIPYSTMWRYNLGPGTVDVEEVAETEVNGSVYPNPVNSVMHISLDKNLGSSAVINMYDISGQLVKAVPFQNTIDVADLPNGMYILDVVDQDLNVFREKFLKH